MPTTASRVKYRDRLVGAIELRRPLPTSLHRYDYRQQDRRSRKRGNPGEIVVYRPMRGLDCVREHADRT